MKDVASRTMFYHITVCISTMNLFRWARQSENQLWLHLPSELLLNRNISYGNMGKNEKMDFSQKKQISYFNVTVVVMKIYEQDIQELQDGVFCWQGLDTSNDSAIHILQQIEFIAKRYMKDNWLLNYDSLTSTCHKTCLHN